ncbi:helix-turn-helix transcriptional regulator [Pseudomaricurvus alkylphenolicus]|uniref:helix-turn-helix domain-containing protein n=1 Tax=Pseudomaricurvus alkylphenolicus TaxID=1306991 RepID=UPI00141E42A4|nr:helix-turn-helix domain-containing protein [Pseudomaricurvus alkylphenolicus]NIB40353.1 helix-turn-helix transcriptional regulator [Pseudomaricurvus alkylphenolicus]
MTSRLNTLTAAAPDKALLERIQQSLQCNIHWWTQYSDNCIDTEWRVLPFAVILNVQTGEYGCELENADTEKVGAGEVLLIPAGVKHRLLVNQHTVAAGLHIHFSLFHNLDVLSFFQVPMRFSAERSQQLFGTIDTLTDSLAVLNQADGFGADTLRWLILKQSSALQLCFDILALSPPLEDSGRRFLQMHRIGPALKAIDTELDQPLRVEELAEACALSRNGFSRLFKQITGQSPLKYINHKRMEQAMSMLVYGEQSIANIAEQVGFCDQFHFSKTFRTETGYSPTQYRSTIRKSLPTNASGEPY